MNANPSVNSLPTLGAHLLGFLLVAGAMAFSMGVKLPFITSYRTAWILLLVAGLVICPIGGIGRVSAAKSWAHPVSILGYLVGALLLVIGGVVLLGRPLPLLNGDRAYLIAISGLMALKLILTQLHPLIR